MTKELKSGEVFWVPVGSFKFWAKGDIWVRYQNSDAWVKLFDDCPDTGLVTVFNTAVWIWAPYGANLECESSRTLQSMVDELYGRFYQNGVLVPGGCTFKETGRPCSKVDIVTVGIDRPQQNEPCPGAGTTVPPTSVPPTARPSTVPPTSPPLGTAYPAPATKVPENQFSYNVGPGWTCSGDAVVDGVVLHDTWETKPAEASSEADTGLALKFSRSALVEFPWRGSCSPDRTIDGRILDLFADNGCGNPLGCVFANRREQNADGSWPSGSWVRSNRR